MTETLLISPARSTSIFRGPNGIRAGWRVLIFVLLMVSMVVLINLTLRLAHAHIGGTSQLSQLSPLGTTLMEAPLFVFPVLASLIMARIERRLFRDYGLPLRSAFGADFWKGSLIGFSAISGVLLALFAAHTFRLTGLAIHGSTIVSAALAWTAAFIFVGLAEEFLFRGYLQYTLTTGMGFWPAAAILSVLFALAHMGNPGESKFGLLNVVIVALLFCLFLRRTGNLWFAVGFHAAWDWGQTFVYGVRDSGVAPYHNLLDSSFTGPRWITGGTVGPEASIFTPIVLAIVAVLFSRFYRENRYAASLSSRP